MEIANGPSKSKKIKPPKRRNPYDSMDPLTQAKYLYDLRMQVGTPITFSEAYKEALSIIQENAEHQRSTELHA